MRDEDSVRLLQELKEGNEEAAQVLFDRYVQRLVALARSRLSARMRRRVEPEDIVQSVCRSFFRHAQEGAYTLPEKKSLWSLLAAITINKVRGQVEFHTAKKRAFQLEVSAIGTRSAYAMPPEALAQEPAAEEAEVILEELGEAMGSLDPLGRQIFELHLAGVPFDEICTEVQRSGRTVRRALEKVRKDLEQRLL